MSAGEGERAPGTDLLEQGIAALDRGDSEDAFELLSRAAEQGVPDSDLPRLAAAFASAARFVSRHADALAWIERELDNGGTPEHRAQLLRARIAVCRQLDVKRVLELADEAIAAAEAIDDTDAVAGILAHAAFAAYRSGDGRAATRFADQFAARELPGRTAEMNAHRARMFAATARGDMEQSMSESRAARDLALELSRTADAANESNNLAETLLELGRPHEAEVQATRALELAEQSGHLQVADFARVMVAVAYAESGKVDEALAQLAQVERIRCNRILALDAMSLEAFWLLERGAAGDAARARDVAERAIEIAEDSGVTNRLTTLWSQIARAWAREAQMDRARDALERARKILDRTDPQSEQHLALAFAEVLAVDEPRRRAALGNARNRILRAASRREDPRAFCTNVRLHRRLLDLSGGVPSDLM